MPTQIIILPPLTPPPPGAVQSVVHPPAQGQKKVRCQFCYENALTILEENQICVYPIMLDGSIISFAHLWKHIMGFLPNISLRKHNRRNIDIATDLHKRLKEIQTFEEPVVTDPMLRIKIKEVDPKKEYEKVVGKSMDDWIE